MMKKVAIVYWSGTGNTEAMAKAIECGVRKSGNAVNLFAVRTVWAGGYERF